MEANYLKDLNTSQYEATVYNDGPQLIIAGAGSGKTRVLTYKIAYLLQQGVPPHRILALTFTNKAANEMKERIASIVGLEIARSLWMGTFHSIFLRILRLEAGEVGFSSDFTIYDTSDSKSAIKSILKEMKLDDKIYKPSGILGKISLLKNKLISSTSYANDNESIKKDYFMKIPAFCDVFMKYENRCRESNAMDFDDLLVYTHKLFVANPQILEFYRNQFEYILIDEYQDTNFAQCTIVNHLAKDKPHICVVGDDAQSIYSFRGANIENILSFQNTYPGCQVFKLERNYRSTQNIVGAANSLIEKNQFQIKKNVFSENSKGNLVELLITYSDCDEAFTIVSKIRDLLLNVKHYKYSDFAILYRTNAQSRVLEDAFRKSGLPYKIYGGLSFYQRKEIKDVISYLRIIVNKDDEEAFKRIINYPARGIGETSQSKIILTAHYSNVSAYAVAKEPLKYALDLNSGLKKKLFDFVSIIDSLTQLSLELNAYDLICRLVKNVGILEDISHEGGVEAQSKKENLEEFLNAAHEFCERRRCEGDEEIGLVNFLSEVSLLSDQDNEKEEEKNKITLMTIHAAKGLEFSNVFITGLEEQLFPSVMCVSEKEIEEERRLLYVAMTRAKENCILTLAKSRFRNGQTQMSLPSRFLKDIDSTLLCTSPNQSSNKFSQYNRGNSSSLKQSSYCNPKFKKVTGMNKASEEEILGSITVGMKVLHSVFGVGIVQSIDGTGENRKAQIDFEHQGVKYLLLKYAKLLKI